VTSSGGTTEQALNVLMNGDIEGLFREALEAAKKRSAELATSLGGK
jgi:pyrroline-5-carboxylate reductase